MRLIENVSALLPLFNLAKAILNKKQENPALQCVLLSVTTKKLTITSNSIDKEYKGVYALENDSQAKSGKCLVNASLILGFLSSLNRTEDVTIEQSKDVVTLSQGDAVCTLPTLDPKEYPTFKHESKSQNSLTLSRLTLMYWLEKTLYASGKDDVRSYLNGINFEVKDKQLRLVATDGHRMSVCGAEVESEDVTGIIGRASAAFLLNYLGNSTHDEVSMEFHGNTIAFKLKDACFNIRTIDGKYPDWRQVIPKKDAANLEFNLHQFRSCVDRARALFQGQSSINKTTAPMGIMVVIANEKIELRITPDPSRGEKIEFHDSVPCNYQDTEIIMRTNVNYLHDAMSALSDEQGLATMRVSDTFSQIQLNPKTQAPELHLLMNMKL